MSSTFDLIFRTDDATRWGDGKGTNLRPDEVDLNFWILLQLFLYLEQNPAQPYQIDSITVSNNQMTIALSDGVTTFGPFTLPVATLNFTGEYQGNHDYSAYDLFTVGQKLYFVVRDCTSNATFDENQSDVGGSLFTFVFQFQPDYDVGFFWPGKPGTGVEDHRPIFAFRARTDFYFPADLTGSVAGFGIEATNDTDYPIYQNDTWVGTIHVAAGATECTFTFATLVQFTTGDLLKVMKPESPSSDSGSQGIDPTAEDFTVTLFGTKGIYEAPSSSA